MPAAFELQIPGGLHSLHCPVTGREVFGEEGFDPEATHSPHLRFFIDWVGEAYIADPGQFDGATAEYQATIARLLADPHPEANQNDLVARCVSVLPSSVLVMEILDPPTGSYDGSICYACFDLAPAPEGLESVSLSAVDEVEV